MSLNRLDQRITLQQETRVDDGGGGHTTTWSDLSENAECWAAVEPLTGREALQAMQVQDSISYKVTIRRRGDLAAKMQIIWQTNADKVLNVRAVLDPGGRGHYMELLADEGRAP